MRVKPAECQQRCRRDCGRAARTTAAERRATCPASPRAPPIAVRGIDLGVGGKITDKWSVFGGLVLMQSEVTQSHVPSAQPLTLYPDQCRAQARQHRASVVQPVDQVSAHRRLGGRRAGGVSLEDVRRHVPGREPGHVDPGYWRFDAFVEAKIDKNWTAKLFVNNITNKLYYDALYQSATPFVFEAPGRSREHGLSARF